MSPICLQGTASKVLELTVGCHDFLSAAMESATPVPRVCRASVHMERWAFGALLYALRGQRWTFNERLQLLPGPGPVTHQFMDILVSSLGGALTLLRIELCCFLVTIPLDFHLLPSSC